MSKKLQSGTRGWQQDPEAKREWRKGASPRSNRRASVYTFVLDSATAGHRHYTDYETARELATATLGLRGLGAGFKAAAGRVQGIVVDKPVGRVFGGDDAFQAAALVAVEIETEGRPYGPLPKEDVDAVTRAALDVGDRDRKRAEHATLDAAEGAVAVTEEVNQLHLRALQTWETLGETERKRVRRILEDRIEAAEEAEENAHYAYDLARDVAEEMGTDRAREHASALKRAWERARDELKVARRPLGDALCDAMNRAGALSLATR